MNWEVWVPVLVALLGGGALTAVVTQWFLRRQTAAGAEKTTAEGRKVQAETDAVQWNGLLTVINERSDFTKDIQEQLNSVRQRANNAEEKVRELQAENLELRKKVADLEIREKQAHAEIDHLKSQLVKLVARLEKVEEDTGSMPPVVKSNQKGAKK